VWQGGKAKPSVRYADPLRFVGHYFGCNVNEESQLWVDHFPRTVSSMDED
jgi:hypothetical protein